MTMAMEFPANVEELQLFFLREIKKGEYAQFLEKD
jgi:hypothetical protein